MKSLNDYADNPIVCAEYERAYLLNIFAQLCDKMKADSSYCASIKRMYRESFNFQYTFGELVKKEFCLELDNEEVSCLCKWLKANFAKKPKRIDIPFKVKEQLYQKQNCKCIICNNDLGNDWSKIHVDHIIPWDYVGDELEDNYQDLCDVCNLEKGNSITYTLLHYLRLTKGR